MERPATSPWGTYYERTKHLPPQESLIEAEELVIQKDAALDIGGGALRDTRHILAQGWKQITVLDQEIQVAELAAELNDSRILCVTQNFESYPFPQNEYDLVNAQYALPFIHPTHFD